MYKNKKKLVLLFVLVAFIANIAGGVGLVVIKTQDANYTNALITYSSVQGNIGNYNAYLSKFDSLVHDILTLTNVSEIKEAQEELNEAEKLAAQSLDNIRRFCKSTEELVLLDQIEEAALKYGEVCKSTVELSLQNKHDNSLSILHNEATSYLNECITLGQELINYNDTMMNVTSSQLIASSKIAMITIAILMIGSILFSIVLAWIVSRK